jgi:hypothetical protein
VGVGEEIWKMDGGESGKEVLFVGAASKYDTNVCRSIVQLL